MLSIKFDNPTQNNKKKSFSIKQSRSMDAANDLCLFNFKSNNFAYRGKFVTTQIYTSYIINVNSFEIFVHSYTLVFLKHSQ